MNGLSVMKRTASTSSSIFAVSSAITSLSGKAVIGPDPFLLIARLGRASE